MGEFERDNGFSLANAVEKALPNPESKHQTELDKFIKQADGLAEGLRAKRDAPETREDKHTASMYDAAHNLVAATLYLLDESPSISKIDPETQDIQPIKEQTSGRMTFLYHVTKALEHLGMDSNAVKKALKESGDY